MLSVTIYLRRLFTRQPSQKEMDFHWWFVTSGINEWQRFLASKGFGHTRRTAIIRTQERTSRRILEVWDTAKFHTWGDRHSQDEAYGDDVVVPHVWATPDAFPHTTSPRTTAIPGGGRSHSPQVFR